MKEKRYFCDWYENLSTKLYNLILVLSTIIIAVCSYFIAYGIVIHNYAYTLESYSTESYKYLESIANEVITEGVGIDLSKMPRDISSYEINYDGDKIIFKYYSSREVPTLSPSEAMTIELSKDYNIISKTSDYSSEGEYVSKVKFAIRASCILIATAFGFVTYVFTAIGLFIANLISKHHKKRDTAKHITN